MKPFIEIENSIDQMSDAAFDDFAAAGQHLLKLGEEILENWIIARGQIPTKELREGFRILALHRQGAKGEPSFNACRETCRELVYHVIVIGECEVEEQQAQIFKLSCLVAKHLCLFVSGKMQVKELGEFCCSSKPLRIQGN